MVVARLLVEELLVPEVELRSAVDRLEDDRHQRDPIGRGAGPAPGEDELAVRHDLPVLAGALVHPAIGAAEGDAKTPAHAHVELGERDRLARCRAPPLPYRLR